MYYYPTIYLFCQIVYHRHLSSQYTQIYFIICNGLWYSMIWMFQNLCNHSSGYGDFYFNIFLLWDCQPDCAFLYCWSMDHILSSQTMYVIHHVTIPTQIDPRAKGCTQALSGAQPFNSLKLSWTHWVSPSTVQLSDLTSVGMEQNFFRRALSEFLVHKIMRCN